MTVTCGYPISNVELPPTHFDLVSKSLVLGPHLSDVQLLSSILLMNQSDQRLILLLAVDIMDRRTVGIFRDSFLDRDLWTSVVEDQVRENELEDTGVLEFWYSD